jgi:hypothetical protein
LAVNAVVSATNVVVNYFAVGLRIVHAVVACFFNPVNLLAFRNASEALFAAMVTSST